MGKTLEYKNPKKSIEAKERRTSKSPRKKIVKKVVKERKHRTRKSEFVVEKNLVESGDAQKDENELCSKLLSRCSPHFLKFVMKKLKPVLGEQQIGRIKDTPFAKWIDIPALAISSSRIDYVLNRFRFDSCSLVVGEDISIPFTSADFSLILGLRYVGQPVDLDLKVDSKFLSRHFEGKVTNARRADIFKKLSSLAASDDSSEFDDFVRFFILFVFNCIIFQTCNYITPAFIFPYLDDLSTFSEYAWGDAAFQFLCRGLRDVGSKTYLDGSTVGLMAWVYERVPVLGVCTGLHVFPRLFRWVESKIPLKFVGAESILNSIDSTQVLPIVPFSEERELLDIKHATELENVRSQVRKFVKILKKQKDELKMLKMKCVELERESILHVATRSLFSKKNDEIIDLKLEDVE
ncbi:uncharacterized protein [Primulina eburnea]|uniref:uncharacterized protein n=1 Tax=Primulina eburnea TaxID=1245227 RepID=UPI003C6C3CFA